jgi:hypothetical protein
MATRIRKFAFASALAAMTLGSVSPAMAQGYGGYRNHDRGDSTGAAIVGGIVGIAIGALIAGGGNRDRDRYRDRGWEYRNGYYWDRQGHRYDRNGRRHDDDRYNNGGGHYRGSDGYGNDNYRGNDGYRGDEGYYGRRGWRDGYRGN